MSVPTRPSLRQTDQNDYTQIHKFIPSSNPLRRPSPDHLSGSEKIPLTESPKFEKKEKLVRAIQKPDNKENLEQEIFKLRQENQNLMREIQLSRNPADLERLQRRIEELTQAYKEKERENEVLNAENHRILSEFANSNRGNEKINALVDELSETHKKLRVSDENLRKSMILISQLENRDSENLVWKERIGALEAENRRLSNLNDQITRNSEKINSLVFEIEQNNQKLRMTQKELSELSQKNEILEEENKRLRRENMGKSGDFSKKTEELIRENSQLQDKIRSLYEENSVLQRKSNGTEKIKELIDENNALQNKIREVLNKTKLLAEENAILLEENRVLKSKGIDSNEISFWQNKCKNLEEKTAMLSTELMRITSNLNEKNGEMEDIKERLQEKTKKASSEKNNEDKIRNLVEENLALQKRIQELNSSQTGYSVKINGFVEENSHLQMKLNEFSGKIRVLADENESLQKTILELRNNKSDSSNYTIKINELAHENNNLQLKLTDLTTKTRILAEENDNLQRLVIELRNNKPDTSNYTIKINELVEENTSLHNKLNEFSSKIRIFVEENEALQRTIVELKSQRKDNSEFTLKINELVDENSHLKTKLSDITNKTRVLAEENDSLQKLIIELRNNKHENSSFSLKIDELTEENHRLQSRLTEITGKTRILVEENESLQRTISDLRNHKPDNSNFTKQINELVEENTVLHSRLSEFSSKIKILAEENDNLQRNISDLRIQKSDISNFTVKINSLVEENAHLQSKLNELGNKMRILAEENEALQKTISDLRLHHSETSSISVQINNLSEENSHLQNKLSDYTLKIKILIEENESLQKKISEFSNLTIKINGLVEENSSLHTKLSEISVKTKLLIEENSALQQKIHELSGNSHDLSYWQTKYNEILRERTELESRLSDNSNISIKIKSLVEENAALQQKLHELTLKNKFLIDELDNLKRTNLDISYNSPEKSRLNQKLFDYEEKIVLLTSEIERLKRISDERDHSFSSDITIKIKGLVEENSALHLKLNEFSSKINFLTEENLSLKKRIDDLSQLSPERTRLNSQIAIYEEKINSLNSELERTKYSISSDFSHKIQDLVAENSALHNKLSEFSSKLTFLSEENYSLKRNYENSLQNTEFLNENARLNSKIKFLESENDVLQRKNRENSESITQLGFEIERLNNLLGEKSARSEKIKQSGIPTDLLEEQKRIFTEKFQLLLVELEEWRKKSLDLERKYNESNEKNAKLSLLIGEIEQYQSIIANKDFRISELNNEINLYRSKPVEVENSFGLREALESKNREIENLRREMNEKQEKIINDFKKIVSSQQIEYSANIKALGEEIVQWQTKCESLRKTGSDQGLLEVRIKHYEEKVTMLSTEIERLNTIIIEKEQAFEREKVRFIDEIHGLKGKFSESDIKERENSFYQEKIRHLGVEVEEYQTLLRKKEERISELERLSSVITSPKREIVQDESKIYEISREKDELIAKLGVVSTEKQLLQQNILRLSNEISELNRVLTDKTNENHRLSGTIETQSLKIKEYMSNLTELQMIQLKYNELQHDMEVYRNNQGISSKIQSDYEERIHILEKNTEDKIRLLSIELQRLNELLKTKFNENQDLVSKLANINEKTMVLAVENEKIQTFLKENKEENENLREKLRLNQHQTQNEKDREIEKLESEIKTKNIEIADLSAKIHGLEGKDSQISIYQQKIGLLASELERINALLIEKMSELENWRTKYSNLVGKQGLLGENQMKVEILSVENRKLQDLLEKNSREYQLKAEEVTRLRLESDELAGRSELKLQVLADELRRISVLLKKTMEDKEELEKKQKEEKEELETKHEKIKKGMVSKSKDENELELKKIREQLESEFKLKLEEEKYKIKENLESEKKNENIRLKEELSKVYQSQVRSLAEEVKHLNTQNTKLFQQLEDSRLEISQLKSKDALYSENNEKNVIYMEKLKEKQIEIEKIKGQLFELQSELIEKDALKKQVQDLENFNRILTEEKAKIKGQTQIVNSTEEYLKERELLQTNLKEKNVEIQNLKTQYEELHLKNQRIPDLEAKINLLIQELEHLNVLLNEKMMENDKLSEKIRSFEYDIEKAPELSVLQGKIKELLAERELLLEANESLRNSIVQIGEISVETQRNPEEIEKLKQRATLLEDYEKKIVLLVEKIDKLTVVLAEKTSENEDLKKTTSQMDLLLKEHERLKQLFEKTQSQLKELMIDQISSTQLADYESKINLLLSENSKINSLNNQLKEHLELSHYEILQRDEKLTRASGELSSIRELLRMRETELRELTVRFDEMQLGSVENTGLQSSLSDNKQKMSSLVLELERMNELSKKTLEENSKLKAIISDRQYGDDKKLETENDELKKKIIQMLYENERLNALTSTSVDSSTKIRKLLEEVQNLRQLLQESISQNEGLKYELTKYQGFQEELPMSTEPLQLELENIKSDNERLSNENKVLLAKLILMEGNNEKEIVDIQETFENVKRSFSETSQTLSEKIIKYENTLNRLLGELEKITKLYQFSEKTRIDLIDQFSKEKKVLIGETEGFKQKFAKMSVELAGLQRERENYKISKEESLKELNNSLGKKEKEISELKDKLINLEITIREFKTLKPLIQEKNSQLEILVEENNRLSNALREKQEKEIQLYDLIAENELEIKAKSVIEIEFSRIMNENQEKTGEIGKLSQKIAEISSDNAVLQEERELLMHKMEMLLSQIERLQRKINENEINQLYLQDQLRKSITLEDQTESISERFKEISKENEDLLLSQRKLESQLLQILNENDRLKRVFELKEKEVFYWQNMIEKEKASDIFEKLRQELRKDNETETIRRLKDEIDLLKGELKSAKIVGNSGEIDKLLKRIKELERENVVKINEFEKMEKENEENRAAFQNLTEKFLRLDQLHVQNTEKLKEKFQILIKSYVDEETNRIRKASEIEQKEYKENTEQLLQQFKEVLQCYSKVKETNKLEQNEIFLDYETKLGDLLKTLERNYSNPILLNISVENIEKLKLNYRSTIQSTLQLQLETQLRTFALEKAELLEKNRQLELSLNQINDFYSNEVSNFKGKIESSILQNVENRLKEVYNKMQSDKLAYERIIAEKDHQLNLLKEVISKFEDNRQKDLEYIRDETLKIKEIQLESLSSEKEAEKIAYESTIEQLKSRIRTLENALENKIQELNKLKASSTEKIKQLEVLRKELKNSGIGADISNVEKESLKRESFDAKENIIRLQNSKNLLENQVKNLKSTIENQKTQIEKLYEVIEERKVEYDNLVKELEKAREINLKSRIEGEDMTFQEKLKEMAREIQELEKSRDNYRLESEKNSKDIIGLNQRLLNKIEELEEVKIRYAEATEKLKDF